MLIISKFRDYYDIAKSIGVDKGCVYKRDTMSIANKYDFIEASGVFELERIGWNKLPYSLNFKYHDKSSKFDNNIGIRPFIIGFCGKTYVGYAFRTARHDNYQNEVVTFQITYGVEEFCKNYILASQKIAARNIFNESDIKKVIALYNKFHDKQHDELFLKYNTPIFVYDFNTGLIDTHGTLLEYPELDTAYGIDNHRKTNRFIINPELACYNFYRVFPPYQAFQEIHMYIGGFLCNTTKEIVEIEEKYKILQHGMDKWSFRNPDPPKRKMRTK